MALVKPKRRADLAVVQIDGEAVIYDERSGHIHRLNQTATLVFECCDGRSTIPDVAADFAAVYGAPVGQMERQIRSVIRRFQLRDLLERRA